MGGSRLWHGSSLPSELFGGLDAVAVSTADVTLVHLVGQALHACLAIDEDGDGILATCLRFPVVELKDSDVVIATIDAGMHS